MNLRDFAVDWEAAPDGLHLVLRCRRGAACGSVVPDQLAEWLAEWRSPGPDLAELLEVATRHHARHHAPLVAEPARQQPHEAPGDPGPILGPQRIDVTQLASGPHLASEPARPEASVLPYSAIVPADSDAGMHHAPQDVPAGSQVKIEGLVYLVTADLRAGDRLERYVDHGRSAVRPLRVPPIRSGWGR